MSGYDLKFIFYLFRLRKKLGSTVGDNYGVCYLGYLFSKVMSFNLEPVRAEYFSRVRNNVFGTIEEVLS